MKPILLVTGFGAFPGVPFNASSALVGWLAETLPKQALSYRLRTATLPTDWREAPASVAELAADIRPDAIIHFGVSSRAREFRIERRAYNLLRKAPDCAGRRPGGPYVMPGKAPTLDATLPVEFLAWTLRRSGLPAVLSSDPGRYLCNATLFNSLSAGNGYAGFIHIPALPPETSAGEADTNALIGWAELRQGAAIILDTVARFVRAPRSAAMPFAANHI